MKEIPYDQYADSHNQLRGRLVMGLLDSNSVVVSALTAWGFPPPWTDETVDYLSTHGLGGRRVVNRNGYTIDNSLMYDLSMALYSPWRNIPVPPVTPITGGLSSATGEIMEPNYPVDHKISSAMRQGLFRNSVYGLEIAWSGTNAFTAKATEEGVLTDAMKAKVQAARDGLLATYNRTKALYDAESAAIAAGQTDEAQAACDAVWNAIHDARREAVAKKAKGYTALPPYGPLADFFKSDLNDIAWSVLSGMSTAASLSGLKGEERQSPTTGPYRDAQYVDAFGSYDSQDPVAREVAATFEEGGLSGALGIGGGK